MPDSVARSLEEIVKSHSRILAEEVRQHPEWLDELRDGPDLKRRFLRLDYDRQLARLPFQQLALAAFRRKCLLRILLRDVIGYATLAETTGDISALADAALDWSYREIRAEAEQQYGLPLLPSGDSCGCSILSVGKLGGMELNYSSDIDLMYVYDGPGETGILSNKEFFEKLAQRQTQFLGAHTAEGLCYRVDLRLRPEGSLGEIALSLEASKDYYRSRARDWELQMMIKARVSAGEPQAGEALIDFVEPFTYATTIDFSAIEAVSATRLRINEKLSARKLRGDALDVKLTRGGIRDIEFLVQCLQRLHGGREPWVRHGGTMLALSRLRDKALISAHESEQLSEAYEFLRNLEHRLQAMEDLQTHSLPESPDEVDDLALRMPRLEPARENTGPRLLQRLKRHLEAVEAIYGKVIYRRPLTQWPSREEHEEPPPVEVPLRLRRQLENSAKKLLLLLGQGPARRNWAQLELLLDRLDRRIALLENDEALARDVLDISDHSPFLMDELIRQPDWLDDLPAMRGPAEASAAWDSAGMRTAFRRRMFRIQCESLCLRRPVFETLAANSDLADQVIALAYRAALREIAKSDDAQHRMMVVALGRLGMREFDLASDADLVFILPNEDRDGLEFWTRVAARIIELLTAYTGEGVIFTVDARLRPYGREGDLVQVEQTYIEYFTQSAEAWEGIAYMKARGVAGDVERATGFLNELQQVDWRRYGQSYRSKQQLRDMRARLEREQGKSSPLKAGRGGYYDIDFALMFLRLRGAGIFFKVLNTPERIDVVEKMGLLEHEDALFLHEAARLYRAVDHGMRLYSGQAAALLPEASSALEPVSEMVTRWMPELALDEPLENIFRRIQDRTRETFERLFS